MTGSIDPLYLPVLPPSKGKQEKYKNYILYALAVILLMGAIGFYATSGGPHQQTLFYPAVGASLALVVVGSVILARLKRADPLKWAEWKRVFNELSTIQERACAQITALKDPNFVPTTVEEAQQKLATLIATIQTNVATPLGISEGWNGWIQGESIRELEQYGQYATTLIEKIHKKCIEKIQEEQGKILDLLIASYAPIFKTGFSDEERRAFVASGIAQERAEAYEKTSPTFSLSRGRIPGWHFLPLINFKDLNEVTELGFEAQHRSLVHTKMETCYQQVTEELKRGATPQTGSSGFMDAIHYMKGEYKIHLMPKREYVFDTLQLILQLIAKNPELKRAIHKIKVHKELSGPLDSEGQQVPTVVVYPIHGKEHAQIVLNELFKGLRSSLDWGDGRCPRNNLRGDNALIFYTMGDSTLKRALRERNPEIFALLYDEGGIHLHSAFGDQHLQLPRGY